MAYETSTATTPDGLLDALRVFALAQGWTVNRWESQTNGYWLSLQKGTQYVNLQSDSTWTTLVGEIRMRGATGYDGGQAMENQPGMRTDTYFSNQTDLSGGSYIAYHFFAGDQFIHCVVEVSSGRYCHFGFGILDKAGAYDGGEYHYASRHYLDHSTISGDGYSGNHHYPFANGTLGTHVRFCENDLSGSDTFKDWATFLVSPASTTVSLSAACWQQGTGDHNYSNTPQGINISRQPNFFNGVSVLIPFTVMCGRRDGQNSILGLPKEVRSINVKNFTPGQELTIGSDTWLIFPIKQKGLAIVGSTTPFSAFYGMAYKKVV